jgi:small subunit ribosomal protein S18
MGMKPRRVFRRRVCIYCEKKFEPDYKVEEVLGRMVTERGKILPRRISGLCAKHQNGVSAQVKRARHMALLPFVAENLR